MSKGYLRVPRYIWKIAGKDARELKALYIELLYLAAYKDMPDRRTGTPLRAGQIFTSLGFLAVRINANSKGRISSLLNKLGSLGMQISHKPTTRGILITIENWKNIQGKHFPNTSRTLDRSINTTEQKTSTENRTLAERLPNTSRTNTIHKYSSTKGSDIEVSRYVSTVLKLFLELAETPDLYSKMDESIALRWFDKDYTLDQVRAAFVTTRIRALSSGVTKINSLKYFEDVLFDLNYRQKNPLHSKPNRLV